MLQAVSSHMGWGLALAVFPVMYGIHRSYQMYFSGMASGMTGGTETSRQSAMVRAARAGV
jgi:hypothetical protein